MNAQINFLLSNNLTKNEFAFIYPLRLHKKRLTSYGLSVDFSSSISSKLFDCSVLIVSSHFARKNNWWTGDRKSEMFYFFESAKSKVDHLVWADMGDSTGATHFEILPFVDRYLKGVMLKDKAHYLKFQYGSRYFTHYYHENYQIEDGDPGEPHLNHIPAEADLDKVCLSWNQAFSNYTHWGFYYDTLKRHFSLLPNFQVSRFAHPSKRRTNEFSCRISSNYGRNTVAFQRARVLEKLKKRIPTNPVSRKEFFAELRNSRIVISPFGWGEICYRDFEATMAGAALMKPDCDHMTTWPDLYKKDSTYLSFDWDLSDFESKLDWAVSNPRYILEIAEHGQELYKSFLNSIDGQQQFCERFNKLMIFDTLITVSKIEDYNHVEKSAKQDFLQI